MKVYEFRVDVTLNGSFHFQNAPEIISKAISSHLFQKGIDKYKEGKSFRYYVFSNFSKTKNKYCEKKNNFIFRTLRKDIFEAMLEFDEYKDKILKVDNIKISYIKPKIIHELITKNQAIITIDRSKNKFFTLREKAQYLKFLNSNLLKKAELFLNEKLENINFIEEIEILNTAPYSFFYEGVRFMGYKFRIYPKQDELSQLLSFVALGAGLGEKNALVGAGFCEYR